MEKKLKICLLILIILSLGISLGLFFSQQAMALDQYCQIGQVQSCTTGEGLPGTQICKPIPDLPEFGQWGECTPMSTPSLNITKMDAPDPVAAGANLVYTLNFAITGADATGVVMTDVIPTNTSFVSVSAPGTYDSLTNKVTWNFGNLAKGNYVATLTVKIYSPLATGSMISNTAIIDSNETDPLSANAETTVSTAPILKIDKLVDKAIANAGDMVLYTIKVTNDGTDTAKNVKLTDTLPAGFTFVDNGKTTITYNFGDIEAGKTVATSYSVKIDASVVVGTYTNTATLTASNHANLTAAKNIDVKTPTVLGEETTKQEVQKEEVIPEPMVLGEETLPVTGASALGTIIVSLISAAGATYIIRKKVS